MSFSKTFGETVLESATVTHSSNTETAVDYTQWGDRHAYSVRVSSGYLVWAFTGLDNANRYALQLDSDRWPLKYFYNVQYIGKKYTNRGSYNMDFAVQDGNLQTVTNSATLTSTGQAGTVSTCTPSCEKRITNSDTGDTDNLSALLLAEDFLPWYMRGLPGNKRLPAKVEYCSFGAASGESEEFSYEKTSGLVTSITRKYYSGSTLLHTREYKISY